MIPGPERRTSGTEATLGAFGEFTRQTLVPILLYKSIFTGEWFNELVRQDPDRATREALVRMSQATLREAIEVLATMRDWESGQGDIDGSVEFLEVVQRRVLRDLMRIKEGSTEVLVLAAMRAPTAATRDRLLYLADLDRQHADALRTLLGANRLGESLDRVPGGGRGISVGAHEGRGDAATLGERVRTLLGVVVEQGDRPTRLVLSHASLRHLRDEHHVAADGTVFGLPVDVDFGWEGECFSIVTDARVGLAEVLSFSQAPRPGRDLVGQGD